VAILRLFASARDAAGTGRDMIGGATVDDVLAEATRRYGPGFEAVLGTAKVWINGEPAQPGDAVSDTDEVAVLPPVSGGAFRDVNVRVDADRELLDDHGRGSVG